MDPLYQFACAYLDRHPIRADMPAEGARSNVGAIEGALLFRDGDFQVQLFSVPPHYIVPAHVHPNVDSIEVYVDGPIKFSHRGAFVFDTIERPCDGDAASYTWRMLRVLPDDMHGAVVGAAGARFMSIQHWLNGVKPDCVGRDYTGPVVDEAHLRDVRTGAPVARRQADLRVHDAL